MENLFATLTIAFVILLLALLAMAIGWLLTGKSRLNRGCGIDPRRLRDDKQCGSDPSCSLCGKKNEKQKTSNDE